MGDFLRRTGWAMLAILFIGTGVVFGVYAIWQGTQQDNPGQSQNQNSSLKGAKMPGYKPVKNVSELRIDELKKGSGKPAKLGSTVTVQYIGALAGDGTVFDTTLDIGQPAIFNLKVGPGGVIEGFAKGIAGMRVGGERQIFIPAEQAYGSKPPAGSGIPPNADLVFDVVLVETQK